MGKIQKINIHTKIQKINKYTMTKTNKYNMIKTYIHNIIQKLNTPNMIYILLCIFIVFTIIFIIVIKNIMFYDDIISDPSINYDIHEDGLCIIKNVLSINEINRLKNQCNNNNYKNIKSYIINNKKINNQIYQYIDHNYIFQDYIFIIKKSSIHTCHRDNNGSFFNKRQKHPSYTLIIYLEKMDKCLGVIPKSHKDKNSFNYNIIDKVQNIVCNPGDAILFDANLLHVGTLNEKEDNLRIQMKITHKNDIDKIPFYNNYNKILDESNNIPFYIKKAQKKLSCMFPVISNLIQNQSKNTIDTYNINIFHKIYSFFFYGKTNFYDFSDVNS